MPHGFLVKLFTLISLSRDLHALLTVPQFCSNPCNFASSRSNSCRIRFKIRYVFPFVSQLSPQVGFQPSFRGGRASLLLTLGWFCFLSSVFSKTFFFLMEEIASHLKTSELKQDILYKAFEELHAQASAILVFSLQWKDLENHFDSTRKSLQTELERFAEREKDFARREKELEIREAELNLNLDSKGKELEGIEKLIDEQVKALESKMQHVDSLKLLIQENREELEVKERQYATIQNLVAEKEREYNSLEQRVKQKSKEVESKEKELNSIQTTLRGYKDDIELKDRKFNAIRRSLEERKKEIELKEEQLRLCRRSIDECDKEIKLKEENLNSLRSSIAECLIELELKQKQLDLVQKDLELKEKNFVLLKKSVDQCAQEFERKEMKIEGCLEELKAKEKLCESKPKELDLMYKKVNECLKECELKQKKFDSLQKLLQKRSRVLEAKESQFEKTVKEFKRKQREVDSSRNSNELRVNAASYESIIKTGKDLQFHLSRHLKRQDLIFGEILSVVQASPDPAKLVLDAMEGFYPSQSSGQNSEFEVNYARISCILLLEKLMESSAQINPQVTVEAIKLATDWKAKMRKENYLEAVGFLQFLNSYKLSSAFDAVEVGSMLDIFGQQRRVSELRQALSTANKAPENSSRNVVTSSSNLQLSTTQNDILAGLQTSPDPAKLVLYYIQGCFSQHWKRGDANFGENVMRNYIFLFEKLLRISPEISPLVKVDAMKLAEEWKPKMRAKTDNHWEVLGFLQFLAAYRLVSSFNEDEILESLETVTHHKEALKSCCNLAFADQIPEFVHNLIQRKKLTDAVGLICSFKLTDKFSPLPLLTKYMEDLKENTKTNCKGKKPLEEKNKITDDEIAALTAVIRCIKDYNLDSKNSLADISKRLKLLERMKTDRRRSALLFQPKVEPEQSPPPSLLQQQQQKRRNDVTYHGQQGGSNKFPRTYSSCVEPRGSSNFIPFVPRLPDFPHPQSAWGGSSNIVRPNGAVFLNAGARF